MTRTNLKLVPKVKNTSARPFETDYAGAWRGRCIRRETAVDAAIRHMGRAKYTSCTITDVRTGEVVVRLRMSKDQMHIHIDYVRPIRRLLGM